MSDHLAFVSKYDSLEWTNALRYFEGWTDHNLHVEESVRSLVLEHKLQGIHEMSDIESSLLRSQINDAILKAMKSEKEKVTQDAYSKVDGPVSGKRNPIHDSNNGNVSHPSCLLVCLYILLVPRAHIVSIIFLSTISGNGLLYTIRHPTRQQQQTETLVGKVLVTMPLTHTK